jgi:hypothetical protein
MESVSNHMQKNTENKVKCSHITGTTPLNDVYINEVITVTHHLKIQCHEVQQTGWQEYETQIQQQGKQLTKTDLQEYLKIFTIQIKHFLSPLTHAYALFSILPPSVYTCMKIAGIIH